MELRNCGIVILWLLVRQSVETVDDYLITKSYFSSPAVRPVKMGKLTMIREGEQLFAELIPDLSVFVTEQDLRKSSVVILTYTNQKTGQTFKSAISSVKKEQHSEKITAVVSSTGEIIGFNYSQLKGVSSDITADVSMPAKAVMHIFSAEPERRKEPEESFFQKYKWYLIVGGVIIYMTMTTNADPEKGQQGQAAQRQ